MKVKNTHNIAVPNTFVDKNKTKIKTLKLNRDIFKNEYKWHITKLLK